MSIWKEGGPALGSSKGLAEVAYERLLEGLFTRRIPAGAFVSQSDLVKMTGLSVGPVRDALIVLQAEGLVRIHPRSGVEIIKPSIELTRAVYQFRSIIEAAAVRSFASSGDTEVIQQLIADHERALEDLSSTDLAEMIPRVDDLDTAIHGTIVDYLDNPIVKVSYQRTWNYLRMLKLERKHTTALERRALNEHLDILRACEARNVVAAENALLAHFSGSLQRNIGLM